MRHPEQGNPETESGFRVASGWGEGWGVTADEDVVSFGAGGMF